MNETSDRLPNDYLKWREFSGYFHFFDKDVSTEDREKFMVARNVVFYHFGRFDEMLTRILTRYFMHFNSLQHQKEFRGNLLENLSFERKRQIVKNLRIIKFGSQEEELDYQKKIREINRIKNAFIRSTPIDSKKFEYNGKHVIYKCSVLRPLDYEARKIFDLYCAVLMELDIEEKRKELRSFKADAPNKQGNTQG